MSNYYSRIGTCSKQAVGKSIDIQIPNGSLVSMKGSQAFSVFTSPYTGNLILRGCKQQIAIGIVLDHRNGSFVSLQQIRALMIINKIKKNNRKMLENAEPYKIPWLRISQPEWNLHLQRVPWSMNW